MNNVIVGLGAVILLTAPAQAQSIYGKWRTESMDPEICVLLSRTLFVDPIAETDCRVTKTEKTGRNTWTLSLTCNIGGDAPAGGWQSQALYLRLLSPNRLRLRQGSDGPLLVYRRC